MVQSNVIIIRYEEFAMIEKTLVLNSFFKIIYTTVPNLLTIILIMLLILDLNIIKYVLGYQTRFLNLTDYKNFYCIANREQLIIKGKENTNFFVENIMLKLLDAFYVQSFTINLIKDAKLWHNGIGIYFLSGRFAKLFFNEKIFLYTDDLRD